MTKYANMLTLTRETVRALRVRTGVAAGLTNNGGSYATVGACDGGGNPVPPSYVGGHLNGGNVCIGQVDLGLTASCPKMKNV